MNNFNGCIYARTKTAPTGGVVGGVPVVIGDLFGVPVATAAEGELFTLAIEGVFTLAKTTGVAFDEGDSVYFDDSTGKATTDSTKRPIGHADEAALSAATTLKTIVFPCSTSDAELTAKADKVTSPTNGNFASLTSTGNLADSGSKAADFSASGHVHAASVITVAAITHETGTDVQAVLADLVARVYALETAT